MSEDDGRDYYDEYGTSADNADLSDKEEEQRGRDGDTDGEDEDETGKETGGKTEQDEDGEDGEGEKEVEEEEEETAPTIVEPERKRNYIVGAGRQSSPIMSRFEFARLWEARAEQLANGSPPSARIAKFDSDDYINMAFQELTHRAKDYEFPVDLHRPMPSGNIEVWTVSELLLPDEVEIYKLVRLNGFKTILS